MMRAEVGLVGPVGDVGLSLDVLEHPVGDQNPGLVVAFAEILLQGREQGAEFGGRPTRLAIHDV
jgi:hypothetical protein